MNDDDIFAPWSDPAPSPSKQDVPAHTTPCYNTLEPAEIKAMLTSTLFDIALNPHNSPSVRIQAANAVMDRDFGKAVQQVDSNINGRMTYAIDDTDRALIEDYISMKRGAVNALPILENEGGGEDTP